MVKTRRPASHHRLLLWYKYRQWRIQELCQTKKLLLVRPCLIWKGLTWALVLLQQIARGGLVWLEVQKQTLEGTCWNYDIYWTISGPSSEVIVIVFKHAASLLHVCQCHQFYLRKNKIQYSKIGLFMIGENINTCLQVLNKPF